MSPPTGFSALRGGSIKKRQYTVQEVMQGQSFSSNASVSEDGRHNENEHPKRGIPQTVEGSDLTIG
jgi:hypothetical protein